MIVFVVIEDMDCDRGGHSDVKAVFKSEEAAKNRVANLETERDHKIVRYKYPVQWWVKEMFVQ